MLVFVQDPLGPVSSAVKDTLIGMWPIIKCVLDYLTDDNRKTDTTETAGTELELELD